MLFYGGNENFRKAQMGHGTKRVGNTALDPLQWSPATWPSNYEISKSQLMFTTMNFVFSFVISIQIKKKKWLNKSIKRKNILNKDKPNLIMNFTFSI